MSPFSSAWLRRNPLDKYLLAWLVLVKDDPETFVLCAEVYLATAIWCAAVFFGHFWI